MKCSFGKIKSGDDQWFTRTQDRFGHRGFGDGGKRCCVTAADILGQGGLDGVTNFCGGQFHAAKMKANGKSKKQKGEGRPWFLGAECVNDLNQA